MQVVNKIMIRSYYAVARGRKVGIYPTWPECKENVDGFPNAKYKKCPNEKMAQEFIGIPIVYTDGACANNGQNQAKAGIGVFWPDGHADNVSEPIRSKVKATNNRAEYYAIKRAIQQAIDKGHSALIIRTDCELIIKSVSRTLWMKGWKETGWKKTNGEAVANQDLLKQIDQLMSKIDVRFEKVRGHSDDYGNDQANSLAKIGAKLYKA